MVWSSYARFYAAEGVFSTFIDPYIVALIHLMYDVS
jgi:hypothetical protein